jgi:hypothetical protein
MWPRIFSGVGTVDEAGRWSTRFVLKNDSVVYSRICFVYPSSFDDVFESVADCARAETAVKFKIIAALRTPNAAHEIPWTAFHCDVRDFTVESTIRSPRFANRSVDPAFRIPSRFATTDNNTGSPTEMGF